MCLSLLEFLSGFFFALFLSPLMLSIFSLIMSILSFTALGSYNGCLESSPCRSGARQRFGERLYSEFGGLLCFCISNCQDPPPAPHYSVAVVALNSDFSLFRPERFQGRFVCFNQSCSGPCSTDCVLTSGYIKSLTN